MKPGALMGGYDWVVTDKYDPNNPEHVRIKKGIELGNGLPDLLNPKVILDAIKEAGFELLEHRDTCLYNPEYEIPWYDSLEGRYWSFSKYVVINGMLGLTFCAASSTHPWACG